MLASAACGGAEPATERHLVAHDISGCPTGAAPSTLLVTALGDFGSARASGTVGAKSTSSLDLPANLVGVQAELLPRGAWGIGYADPPQDVSFALWSTDDACDATGPVVSASLGGEAMTAFAAGRAVLVAGLMPVPSGIPYRNSAAFALSFDLMTGEVSPNVAMAGLPRPRAFASATAFGDGVLVAGGIDPNDRSETDDDVVASTAFVFSAGQFENGSIELGDARAHHGAVTLASGETLLVGGVGQNGAPLATVEAIDPVTRNSRFFQLGLLHQPRRDPVVLRLADDEILVAGGTDGSGAPASEIEWLDSDGSACMRAPCTVELGAIADRAYVALPSGAVLVAGGMDPLRGTVVSDVLWVRPDRSVDALSPLPAEQRGAGKLRLVAASDGAAWLFNGRDWWEFDPWQGLFVPPEAAPRDGPDDDMPAPLAIDPGLFLWLARDAAHDPTSPSRLRGFRHDVRGPFTRDADVMLLSDAVHWVPDRPPRPEGDIEFRAGLRVGNGSRAVLADMVYADFDLRASATARVLPKLALGTFMIGEGACAWPAPTGYELEVTRRGASLDVRVDDQHRTCTGPSGRVGIGLSAPDAGSATVTKFSISRL